MIEVKHLFKSFGDKEVLKDINIVFEDGKTNLIIGQSGAGKTVLMRSLTGLLDPTKGEVLYDGRNFVNMTKKDQILMRREMGMIFQGAALFDSLTVLENVRFPLDMFSDMTAQERDKRAMECLDRVNLTGAEQKFPGEISGGMQKRVAIARALASDPKVLLCDEATSALDPATTQSILKLLKEINRTLGITILLITHEMEVVKQICDQVAVIDQGRLVEQGTVGEIFANPKTELAQEFIRSTFHISLPDEYLENLTDTPKHSKAYPIIKFEFTGRSVDAPLLSQASKKFGVELSILTSQIDYAGGVKFGYTIAEVEGDEDAITQTKVYLMENNVRVEVLGYVQ